MTHKYRRFATIFEAYAFASGLETASDGSIHHVEKNHCDPPVSGFSHVVTWTDENSDARRLQQEPHKAPMTPQEYVREHKGGICPVCRGMDFEGHFVEINGDTATQEVTCNNPDCGASWNDIYELSGYELRD